MAEHKCFIQHSALIINKMIISNISQPYTSLKVQHKLFSYEVFLICYCYGYQLKHIKNMHTESCPLESAWEILPHGNPWAPSGSTESKSLEYCNVENLLKLFWSSLVRSPSSPEAPDMAHFTVLGFTLRVPTRASKRLAHLSSWKRTSDFALPISI